MSIASEISRIANNVSDALEAIANKGVTVPVTAKSDDLSTLIALIVSAPDGNLLEYGNAIPATVGTAMAGLSKIGE